MTNKQVAYAHDPSRPSRTTRAPSSRLSVNDRTQAVVYAMRQGWIRMPRTDVDRPRDTAGLGVKGLSSRLADDLLTLDKELGEIDLLISQARTEAGRHESRREAAAGKREPLSMPTPATASSSRPR